MSAQRLYDGFTSLERGMSGGRSPSLIGRNQVSASCNFSFRNGFAHSRPPFSNLLLTFDSVTTQSRWSGIFQGAMYYHAEFGNSGIIASIGGRLFRIEIGSTNNITEITPVLKIVTTEDFTVPIVGGNVTVDVSSEAAFSNGDTVFIDSGQYTVVNRANKQIILIYVGGATHATVTKGTAVLDALLVQASVYQTNPATYDFVHLFPAENYAIIFAGQQKPVFYDGKTARVARIGEIPPSSLGIYAWGRIWFVFPDLRTFGAGDIVYGPSGTASLGFRDSILKVTENDFLNEGGFFAVPNNAGPITAMQLLNTQDTSLGTGPLLVGTSNGVFSVNAPVDRTTWKNLTYPIQTVALIDYGPVGPRNQTPINGDWWYRSLDGYRSFRVARQEIDQWGNTPMSDEIRNILDFDTLPLLFYGSEIYFDNKKFGTVSPMRGPNGVVHSGLSVINFDEISGIEGKSSPAWEGAVSGLQIFQVLKGRIDEKERAFAFVLNDSNGIELWEIKREQEGFYDQFISVSGQDTSITRTSIQSFLETRSMDFQTPFTPKLLNMAELYLDDIVDNITLVVKFKPDQYPSWITWATIPICATVSQCTVSLPTGGQCSVWLKDQKQYAARVLLPSPPEICNIIEDIPVNIGSEFQFRFELTGHAQIRQFRAHTIPQPQNTDGVCPPAASCKTFPACDTKWFGVYDSHGT